MKKLLLVACLGAALSGIAYANAPGDTGPGGAPVAHYVPGQIGPGGWSVYLLGIWLGLVL